MAEASDRLGILRQNLQDAGCDERTVLHCMQLIGDNDWNGLSRLLTKQRRELLRKVHTGQKEIDCLDYLQYQIRKNHMGG